MTLYLTYKILVNIEGSIEDEAFAWWKRVTTTVETWALKNASDLAATILYSTYLVDVFWTQLPIPIQPM